MEELIEKMGTSGMSGGSFLIKRKKIKHNKVIDMKRSLSIKEVEKALGINYMRPMKLTPADSVDILKRT
ncbi:Uncharacterised protein [Bacillus freudenreichii]|nr:Uncharacterised protein [Bacillus freudenreichii]